MIILVLVIAATAFGAVFRHKIRLARHRFAGPEKGGGAGTAPTGGGAASRGAKAADGSTDRPNP